MNYFTLPSSGGKSSNPQPQGTTGDSRPRGAVRRGFSKARGGEGAEAGRRQAPGAARHAGALGHGWLFLFLGLGPWNFLEKLRRLNRCGCLVEFSFPPGVWNGCFVGMKRYNCLVVSNIVHVEQFWTIEMGRWSLMGSIFFGGVETTNQHTWMLNGWNHTYWYCKL